VWEEASAYFEPDELAQLVWAITVINAWNRIAITTRMLPAAEVPMITRSSKNPLVDVSERAIRSPERKR
jgi:hypothetical protein